MDLDTQANRRRYRRSTARCVVQLSPLETDQSPVAPCVSRDISEGGISVLAADGGENLSHLLVSIEENRGAWTHITSRTGAVVRSTPERSEGQTLLGIEFSA